MNKQINLTNNLSDNNNLALLRKIDESFSALEDALYYLGLDEPLFIVNVAKKSFANNVFNNVKECQNKKTN